MASARGPVYQFHWQNAADPRQTRLVEESRPLQSGEEASTWLESLTRHLPNQPPGWVPLVCYERSKHFVRDKGAEA